MQSILSLENKHLGEDIYILAAGKSVDFYPKNFLDDRIVIGVNHTWKMFDVTYSVFKEMDGKPNVPLIMPKHSHGLSATPLNEADYIFEHNHNECAEIKFDGVHPYGEKIIVSWSSITSAIHLAAFMGARAVFLIGHDCATLDNYQIAEGYYNGARPATASGDYPIWVGKIAPQTAIVRDWLLKEYGVPLISLSPFIGLKHEGHEIA